MKLDPNVADPDPWGLDGPQGPSTDGTPNIGCESDVAASGSGVSVLSESTSRTAQTSSGQSALAATGSSTGLALATMAAGLICLGLAARRSELGLRWYATSTPGVRYTIEQQTGRRRATPDTPGDERS